ncbi:MAG TPA: hypothetical protein VMS17_02625 [Gemmataceae bacterium]|nr:hypothetical protein [Gemmataceae bacterium]
MADQTIGLIQRVQTILGVRSDFLDAVCQWYGDVRLARKVVKLLARRRRGGRVSLTVNGCQLAADAANVTPQARHVTWQLGAGVFAAGDNEIVVYVEKADGRPLLVRAVQVLQEGVLPWQTVDLAAKNPKPTPHLRLATCAGERRRHEGWELSTGAYVTCRLQLPAALPVTFTLALPGDEADWFDDFKDVIDDIEDRVKEKLNDMLGEQQRVARTDPNGARRLETKIADLTAYLKLQKMQIEPALCGGGDRTLQEVIARTGDPDKLVDRWTPPVTAELAAPPRPAPPPPVPAPYRSAPPRAARGGCAGAFLKLLVVVGLIVGGLAYGVWNYLLPKSVARFDSLTEGQTVAAGAPLQVWLSGQDLVGVKSLSLAVESGGDLVEAPPGPAITFPSGTTDTGTQVFTLTLKPYQGSEQSITLVASLTTVWGNTATARRIIKVGGTQPSLVYEINPPNPKPGQGVEVVIHAVNTAPGALVSYTLLGTDGYPLQGTLPVGPNGTVRYDVLGGAAGVRDDLDAHVEGTSVSQKSSYHFGQ